MTRLKGNFNDTGSEDGVTVTIAAAENPLRPMWGPCRRSKALSGLHKPSSNEKGLFRPTDRALNTSEEFDLAYSWWKSKWVLEHNVVPMYAEDTLER